MTLHNPLVVDEGSIGTAKITDQQSILMQGNLKMAPTNHWIGHDNIRRRLTTNGKNMSLVSWRGSRHRGLDLGLDLVWRTAELCNTLHIQLVCTEQNLIIESKECLVDTMTIYECTVGAVQIRN